MIAVLKAADRFIAQFCKYAAIACFLGLFFLLGAAIILRLVPMITIQGYDEIVELLFIWIVMLAGLALWREGSLYRVGMLEDMLPPRGKYVLELLINLCMLVFALILVIYGFEFMQIAGETTPFLRLDKGWWYAAIPVCGSLMVVYSLVWLWRVATGRAALDSGANVLS